ncbi:MAG: 2-phospho-L-lactate transferase [Thaumarchaeota archaeon]|nr:2-phospho-L-lactate transferase [Candidatus Calditenuaceae archaeon]MDW8186712.1 2-phospho-L-lactate transferase [Nitrososphaerota archaeon]
MVLFSGGVGGSRLAAGLYDLLGEALVVIVNTADDEVIYGLHVSPDIDTVIYALSGIGDWERGWGIKGDTFRCNEMIGVLGFENWFKIGDSDMAVNLMRNKMLAEGFSLTEATEVISRRLGLRCRVLPMTDYRVVSVVVTDEGPMTFQEYFVKRRTEPRVIDVRWERSPSEHPAPGVVEALRSAETMVFAPSNPILSIHPILETRGVIEEIRLSEAVKVAVSPIVGGKAIRGPADKLLEAYGYEKGVLGVAEFFDGLIEGLVIDRIDSDQAHSLKSRFGIEVLVTDTIMTSREVAKRLAGEVIEFAEQIRRARN